MTTTGQHSASARASMLLNIRMDPMTRARQKIEAAGRLAAAHAQESCANV